MDLGGGRPIEGLRARGAANAQVYCYLTAGDVIPRAQPASLDADESGVGSSR